MEEAMAGLHGVRTQADDRVTRLARTVERLSAELVSVKAQLVSASVAQEAYERKRSQLLGESLEALEEELAAVSAESEAARGAAMPFLTAGTFTTKFTDRDGQRGTFAGTFSPHFLWQLSEQTLFESHVDLILRDSETKVDLEFANVTHLLNEHVTLGAGLFLTPFGYYQERIHTAWVNKLPTEPLAMADDGLTPTHSLGAEVRGVVPLPIADCQLNYAVYVSNGPELNTGASTAADAGKLDFDNFDDSNDRKDVGGRIGFLPVDGLELGYSLSGGEVGPRGTAFQEVDAFLQGADVSYTDLIPPLRGTLTLYGEWIWSDVDRADYGRGAFDNERSGGYLQMAYRPSQVRFGVVKNFETVLRYDVLDLPTGAPVFDQERWTLGLNYWLGPTAVVKAAYERAFQEHAAGDETDDDAILVEVAVGF